MNLRIGRAAVSFLVLLIPCAGTGCRGTTLRGGNPSCQPKTDWAEVRRLARLGAAPGDEHGALAFVPRREARTFYTGSGGQFWYYFNLYYWAAGRPETKNLWIKAVVVASYRDWKRWPDGADVEAPPPKTTVEYWEVHTGRSVSIDNHKDFWWAKDDTCAGAVDVTLTLELGRFEVKTPTGWGKPRVAYVLDRKDYGREAGLREGTGRFEPLAGAPVNVFGYSIPWSTCPAKFVRSNWEEMKIPEIRLIASWVRIPVAKPPAVLTDDR